MLAELLNVNENNDLFSYLITCNAVEGKGEEFSKNFTNQKSFFQQLARYNTQSKIITKFT